MGEIVSNQDDIKVGKYIIIQRQDYMKLHKFSSTTSCASLAKDQIELANIENCKYYSTFKMIPKVTGRNRTCTLEKSDSSCMSLRDNVTIAESGKDNRNITDDGRSQKLTTEEIIALRENSSSSTDIVETLISNSNTFHSKTEFSQQKYLKKKEKKYFEYLQIRKPTIRLIADIMYRQDSAKILGIRPDTLSQILSYSNVSGVGNHLLYDSGTNGLISAAMLNSIGAKTEGQLIHAHPGNSCQKQALLAMNFDEEQMNRCISVNLYSVLRHYHQNATVDNGESGKTQLEKETGDTESQNETKMADGRDEESRKRKLSLETDNESCKLFKKDEEFVDQTKNGEDITKKVQKWELENERVCVLFRGKVDSLVITCKEHPMSIFKVLVPMLKASRPFVIFNNYQEPLQECYIAMRKMNNVSGLKLISNWMRGYQVLPERTHPDVLMQGSSGFLLTGWIVQ